eukprot:SAG11_NODE_10693_length_811_cov_5.359551_2_plen_25_part_01
MRAQFSPFDHSLRLGWGEVRLEQNS